MQEKQLNNLIVTKLTEISELKGIELTDKQYIVWTKNILNDFKNGIITDPEKGFEHLKQEKVYGGLDYAIFLEGARINESEKAEQDWADVLSFKRSGDTKVSLKAKKVISNLGGMNWLWDSKKDEINYYKKIFIDTWKNIPEPERNDFRCQGIEDNRIYFPETKQKMLGGE